MNGASSLLAELVHSSPGRIRLRVKPEDLGSPKLSGVRQRLTALPGVREVQLNPFARSILVLYDDDSIDPSTLLRAIGQAGVTVVPDSSLAGRGLMSRPLDESIVSFFGSADEKLRRQSDGFVDLRTLAPVALAALAAREMLSGRLGAAPWYVLLWYAFNSFVNLRRPGESPGRPQAG